MTQALPSPLDAWSSALDDFEAFLRWQQLRYSTIKGYRSHLETLAGVAPDGPWTVKGEDVGQWLDGRGRSRAAARAAARSFYSWGTRCGYVRRSPVPATSAAARTVAAVQDDARVPVRWREPLATYAAWMRAAGRRPRSMDVALTYLRRFAVEHPDPWLATGEDCAAWMGARDWAAETRKSARAALRGFYRHAVNAGRLEVSPAEQLGAVRVPRGLPRPVPQGELVAALTDATDRDRLMVLLAAYAGLRCGEIAAVRPSTDLQDGFLYVTGKGGNVRRVPVHPVLDVELQDELGRRRAGRVGSGFRWTGEVTGADGYLFPSPAGGHVSPGAVSRRLGQVLAGRWSAHTLRHRFASAAYAATRDLRAVQELLGHASPTTTARYTLTPDTALRAAVLGIE